MKKGSMTKAIPPKLRQEIAEDEFYKGCCIRSAGIDGCAGIIQWHHNLIYSGKRVNAKFCILPVCQRHHENESRKDIKEELNRIMATRAEKSDIAKYPRFKWSRYL